MRTASQVVALTPASAAAMFEQVLYLPIFCPSLSGLTKSAATLGDSLPCVLG